MKTLFKLYTTCHLPLLLCTTLLTAIFAPPVFATLHQKTTKHPLLINGAGASFPYILYSKWFSEYRKHDPTVMINYRSIGSGGGIRQFLAGTLDFGATDVPIPKTTLQKQKQKIQQIPVALGAVVVSYNLPTIKNAPLNLTAGTLADIYMGKITKWNDAKIQATNPKQKLPDQHIIPIYRADGSGTTAVFTQYLSAFSKKWFRQIGHGKSVNWSTGLGGKGNEGVMGLIRKMPGSIGYIALSYAQHHKSPTATLQNQSGHFVKASIPTVHNAAQQIATKKQYNLFQPLHVATGAKAYPLASYTYILVHNKMPHQKGKALVTFLKWALTKGQSFCAPLYYIPLPSLVAQKVLKTVKSISTTHKLKKTI